MDNKTFITNLAKRLDIDAKNTSALVDALATVLSEHCSNLDAVAVPGFGNFIPVKHEERIATDPSTGKRTLFPPEIILDFAPGSMLKRQISEKL